MNSKISSSELVNGAVVQGTEKETETLAMRTGDSEAMVEHHTTGPAYEHDKWIYRMVVIILGLVVVLAAGGAIVLVVSSKTPPDALIALGSAALGALAGLMAPFPAGGR